MHGLGAALSTLLLSMVLSDPQPRPYHPSSTDPLSPKWPYSYITRRIKKGEKTPPSSAKANTISEVVSMSSNQLFGFISLKFMSLGKTGLVEEFGNPEPAIDGNS